MLKCRDKVGARGIDAVLYKVVKHLLATLDKMGCEEAFNPGKPVVVLVTDITIQNLTGRTQSL